jgi:NDP-sugar pyrophosphorylase family protein
MVMKNSAKQAMILAAGKATRLYPLTYDLPKVLLPVGGKPLLQHIIDWLGSHGICEIAINLHYLGEQIKEYALDQDCQQFAFSQEDEIMGTAGGVKKMGNFFRDTFVVVYGDVYTNFDLSRMIAFHRKKKALATLAVYRAESASGVGVVETEDTGRITHFIEKPEPGAIPNPLVNGGVYIMEKEVLAAIPSGVACDFAYDIFPALLTSVRGLYAYMLEPDEFIIDIGTLSGYHYAKSSCWHEGGHRNCLIITARSASCSPPLTSTMPLPKP